MRHFFLSLAAASAAAAFGNKDFAGAAAKFEEVIDKGMDDETAASLVRIQSPRQIVKGLE